MTKFVLVWKKDKSNVFEARVIGNANQSSPSYSDIGWVGDPTIDQAQANVWTFRQRQGYEISPLLPWPESNIITLYEQELNLVQFPPALSLD